MEDLSGWGWLWPTSGEMWQEAEMAKELLPTKMLLGGRRIKPKIGGINIRHNSSVNITNMDFVENPRAVNELRGPFWEN